MIKIALKVAAPRSPSRRGDSRRASHPRGPVRGRRPRSRMLDGPLAALSDRHVTTLLRELEASEAEETASRAVMASEDRLLDPGFDEEAGDWDARTCGLSRTWVASSFQHDEGDGSH